MCNLDNLTSAELCASSFAIIGRQRITLDELSIAGSWNAMIILKNIYILTDYNIKTMLAVDKPHDKLCRQTST